MRGKKLYTILVPGVLKINDLTLQDEYAITRRHTHNCAFSCLPRLLLQFYRNYFTSGVLKWIDSLPYLHQAITLTCLVWTTLSQSYLHPAWPSRSNSCSLQVQETNWACEHRQGLVNPCFGLLILDVSSLLLWNTPQDSSLLKPNHLNQGHVNQASVLCAAADLLLRSHTIVYLSLLRLRPLNQPS